MISDQDVGPPYFVEQNYASKPYDEYHHYQSITAHVDPYYRKRSFEELRLLEYEAGRYTTIHSSAAIPSCFGRSLPVGGPAHSRRPIHASRDDTCKLDGKVVVFLVGTHAPKKFTVHENIVKASSEFVRLALRGDWVEASSRTILLPEDEPAVFSVYQHWLYNGLIHTVRQGTTTPSSESEDEYALLVKAYILGEKILDVAFKSSSMDAIVEKVGQGTFNKKLTSLVWDDTPSASPLRRLWVYVYYHVGNVDWLRPSFCDDTPSRWFLIEFGRFQTANRDLERSSNKLMLPLGCTYHEHRLEMRMKAISVLQ